MVDLVVITGPDKTGKTILSRHLNELVKDYPSIKLAGPTHFEQSSFFFYKQMGKFFSFGAKIGDRLNWPYLAALSHGVMLYMHKRLTKKCESKNINVVHIRHPEIDNEVYVELYFKKNNWFNNFVRDKIVPCFSATLEPKTPIIYLNASLDTILNRIEINDETRQVHETADDLESILKNYDVQLGKFGEGGHRIIVVDTDNLQREGVIDKVNGELLKIINEHGLTPEPRQTTRERIIAKYKKYKPFSEQRIDDTIERLIFNKKLITEDDVQHIKKGIDENEYLVKYLAVCAGISLADPTGIAFVAQTMVVRESFIGASAIFELYRKNYSRALTHSLMFLVGWIPKIGGICYLAPITLKDPKTGSFLTYHLCNYVTKRDPDELMYKIGSFSPFRYTVKGLDKSGLTEIYRGVKRDDKKELEDLLPPEKVGEGRSREYWNNLKDAKRIMWDYTIKDSFLKGARS